MTLKECLKLREWLKNRGFSEQAFIECLEYVSGQPQKKEEPTDSTQKDR